MVDWEKRLPDIENTVFLSAGQFTAQQPWLHPWVTVDSYELIYVLRGTVRLQEGDTVAEAAHGQWLLLRPHAAHGGVGEPQQDVSFWWFHFTLPQLPPPLTGPAMPLPHTADTARLTGLARQLLYCASTAAYPTVARDMLIRLILTELCVLTDAAPADPLLARVTEWIRINRDTPLTAASVAAHFGYHRDYLSRRFKAAYGVGLKEYLIGQRMDLARQLLLDRRLPLKEVAARVGYTDYKLFLKAFTYHQHVTPTQYRQAAASVHTNKR